MIMKLTSKSYTTVASLTRAFSNLSVVRDISKAPKRPPTAFANFVKEELAGTADRKIPIKEYMVELGQKWKLLDDSKKQPYLSKYDKDNAKYKEDMEAFKAKLGPEGLREYINKKHEAKQAKQEKALKRLHRAQRDPNMPKRPMTSFFLFCKEFRAENGSKLPEKIAEQSQYLSKLWKEMSESQKQRYIDEYTAAKEKYTQDMDNYNKSNHN